MRLHHGVYVLSQNHIRASFTCASRIAEDMNDTLDHFNEEIQEALSGWTYTCVCVCMFWGSAWNVLFSPQPSLSYLACQDLLTHTRAHTHGNENTMHNERTQCTCELRVCDPKAHVRHTATPKKYKPRQTLLGLQRAGSECVATFNTHTHVAILSARFHSKEGLLLVGRKQLSPSSSLPLSKGVRYHKAMQKHWELRVCLFVF